MADQVAVTIPKTIWPERSAFTATAYFRTRSSAASSTPTTVHYKIVNQSRKETVSDWTSATPGASVSIAVTAANNTLSNDNYGGTKRQRFTLLVSSDKGTATEAIGAANYQVRDLFGVS
ncbi:MAG: hypothetical protein GOVbin7744_26 [Prokaryotic dsDNA virus sp.]|nr:MAG: hypothetical protein GOVbin7744_26 [Prokaryotic dsDNA virus sp.]|tara:strand:+ start:9800 stop:10156 length:357 start_codon:yes stop_codon:yes gene_type:complete